MAKKLPKIVKEIKKFKPEPLNYSYQKGVSHSQHSIYRDCPKRWELQYKKGLKPFSSSIHTVFGTSIHEALQYYLDLVYNHSIKASEEADIIKIFEDTFREEYKKHYTKNKSQHFTTGEEMNEFYEDGVEIIKYFIKKRSKYFSKRGWFLVGCEIPLMQKSHPFYNHVLFNGFLDVVLYHEPTETFKIIDLKTSTNGWNKHAKKDEGKLNQLILYKHFFAKQFNVPSNKIEVEFLILKRKVFESNDYPTYRIQSFSPPSGKNKTNNATKALIEFINNTFDKTGYKQKEYNPTPSKWSCRFCPFLNTEHCDKGVG